MTNPYHYEHDSRKASNNPSFPQWLNFQVGRTDAVGAFARAVTIDKSPNKPDDLNQNVQAWIVYLEALDASDDAKKGCVKAWDEYAASKEGRS